MSNKNTGLDELCKKLLTPEILNNASSLINDYSKIEFDPESRVVAEQLLDYMCGADNVKKGNEYLQQILKEEGNGVLFDTTDPYSLVSFLKNPVYQEQIKNKCVKMMEKNGIGITPELENLLDVTLNEFDNVDLSNISDKINVPDDVKILDISRELLKLSRKNKSEKIVFDENSRFKFQFENGHLKVFSV